MAGGSMLALPFSYCLIAAAAVAGALSGMVLVYSTDLPQVTELEQFRPSTITELYDDQDRVIGQFALQRRVIDKYDDFPKVLRDAIISTEDKDFEQSLGRGRVARVRCRLSRRLGWTAARRAPRRSPCSFRATCFCRPTAISAARCRK